MRTYHTDVLIRARASAVWSVLADFPRYPEWNPLVGRLTGDLRAGGVIEVMIVPLGRSFRARLDTFEENEEIRWTGTVLGSWLLEGDHYYRLEPEGRGATRLRHGEYFRGVASGLIPPFLVKRMEAAFVAHNEALKARVEGG